MRTPGEEGAIDGLRPTDVRGADGGPGFTSIEICAGAGGQAYGIELSGFRHLQLVEHDKWCCQTLRNRRTWRDAVIELDLHDWSGMPFRGKIDLFAGGVPCPPFSRAGMGLGPHDERDLFPKAVELILQCRPRAVMLENVIEILSAKFADYRENVIEGPLRDAGYWLDWKLVEASEFGVPQWRRRAVLVAIRRGISQHFRWPEGNLQRSGTVGESLKSLMAEHGWHGAEEWAERADRIAPTLVGGSKKHGGADLGPSHTKKQWLELGVDGMGVANDPPPPSWNGDPPMLTVKMAAVLQGFPVDWPFEGGKTNTYRQVGNAFPPPVAEAIGLEIWLSLALYDATLRGAQKRREAAPNGAVNGAL